eukprot:1193638-Prorocentrum_minimum.AAC.5
MESDHTTVNLASSARSGPALVWVSRTWPDRKLMEVWNVRLLSQTPLMLCNTSDGWFMRYWRASSVEGDDIQDTLFAMTGQRTVPSVFIGELPTANLHSQLHIELASA